MNNNRIIATGPLGNPLILFEDLQRMHNNPVQRVRETTEIIVDGPKIGTRIFEHPYREVFLYILEQLQLLNKLNWRQEFKSLRAVCTIGQQAFEVFQGGDPIGKFWDKFIISTFINNLLNKGEDNYKLDLVSKFSFKRKLILEDNAGMQLFLDYLDSKESSQNTSVQKTQTIEKLGLTSLSSNEEGHRLLKEILKQISIRQDNAFCNLRHLRTSEVSDLTDFVLPSSIEIFESGMDNENVNICGFQHLKSIILQWIPLPGSFKMENLPNLESITISMLYKDIKIKLNEFPKLVSIKVGGQNIPFDRSINELTIKRSFWALPQHNFLIEMQI